MDIDIHNLVDERSSPIMEPQKQVVLARFIVGNYARVF